MTLLVLNTWRITTASSTLTRDRQGGDVPHRFSELKAELDSEVQGWREGHRRETQPVGITDFALDFAGYRQ